MQIDFHHTVTYVSARFAGFNHAQAETISYCSQYVDDATNSGTILFDNDAMYTRVSSAHKMVDHRNLNEVANHHVWLPFHFLPGNGGLAADKSPGGGFIEKIICRPDSPVAGDVLRACIDDKGSRYALHRLGVTMHVYADTWAHQGFAGVNHRVNAASALDDGDGPQRSAWSRIKEEVQDLWAAAMNGFTKVMPLGHGTALFYPDMPYLTWRYTDHAKREVVRNNTEDFITAANAMCRAMQQYRGAASTGLPDGGRKTIRELFETVTDVDGDARHTKWLRAIAEDRFGFGAVQLAYQAKGPGSWKQKALGTERDIDLPGERYPYREEFLSSDWKLFHDALQAHRFSVIYDILPKYGICAA